jgi:hypothetical protein
MTEYRVGDEGATVFDEHGRLLVRLGPGSLIIPGTLTDTVAPRRTTDEPPTGYDDKVIRREHPEHP